MSVPEQKPIVVYKANGTTTNFPITFDLHDTEQLFVVVNNEVPEVGAYTVLNKEVVFAVAPKNGDEITVSRMTALERETDYKSFNNSFRPQSLNWDFNKIWHVLQESNLIDAHILARLKQEIEWRRTHDANIVENIDNETEQRRALDQHIRAEIVQELQDRQAADDQIRTEIEQEVSARRALDLNYDMLAQARDMQVFTALKQYLDTIIASATPNIFGGVTAGIVFALDKKSIQTHLEEILDQLAQDRADIESKSDATYMQNELNKKASITYVDSVVNAAAEGKKFFRTQASLLASTGDFEGQVAEALDTHKVYFWQTSDWVDTGLSELDLAVVEINKMRGSVNGGENLNIYRRQGSWGIASTVVEAGKQAGNLEYPADIVSEFAELRCSETSLGHITQTLTQQSGIWMRLISAYNGETRIDWQRIADTNNFTSLLTNFNNSRGSVNGGENLNIYRRQGSWGIASSVIEAAKQAGNLEYPADIVSEFAELRCSETSLGHITQVITQQSGIWMRLIGAVSGATQVDWVRIVDRNKQYLQNITLTGNDNLNDLGANLYSFSSAVLEVAIDAGDKNYPAVNRKTGGGQIVVSSLNTGHQIQTITFSQAAAVYTRQKLGSVFTEWVVIGDQKTNYVSLGEDLKTYTKRGTWGIASNVVEAGKASNLGYPTDAVNAFAELSCSQTHLSHTTQLFTQQDGIWMRLIGSNSGNTQIDWIRIVDRNKKFFENYTLESSTDLNTVRTEGIYAFTTTTLNEVIDAGNTKNYPAGLIRGLGGGHLIVSKSGNFPIQTIIFTRQARIFSRQLLGSSFTTWVEVGNQKTVIAHGSSSMAGMNNQMLGVIWNLGAVYVNAALGGQIMEGMEAYQESTPLKISFDAGITPANNTAVAVTLHQNHGYTGGLSLFGINDVELSNGLKGTLNLTNKTFTASNATKTYNVADMQFKVDFGYGRYSRDAIHIFNIGKNNIISGNYTAEEIINSNKKMIEHIDKLYNRKFIVLGHYNNNNFVDIHKTKVAGVNAQLKILFGNHYLDTQDYLMSSQIWTDLNITPSQDDLTAQSNGVLALSLSKDSGVHLSDKVNALIAEKIRLKLIELNYF